MCSIMFACGLWFVVLCVRVSVRGVGALVSPLVHLYFVFY